MKEDKLMAFIENIMKDVLHLLAHAIEWTSLCKYFKKEPTKYYSIKKYISSRLFDLDIVLLQVCFHLLDCQNPFDVIMNCLKRNPPKYEETYDAKYMG